MARMTNEITLKVENFIKDTRLFSCWTKNCRFNHFRFGEANCELKQISIDNNGKCDRFEEVQPYVYSEDEINEQNIRKVKEHFDGKTTKNKNRR